jgi:hypothetical protein
VVAPPQRQPVVWIHGASICGGHRACLPCWGAWHELIDGCWGGQIGLADASGPAAASSLPLCDASTKVHRELFIGNMPDGVNFSPPSLAIVTVSSLLSPPPTGRTCRSHQVRAADPVLVGCARAGVNEQMMLEFLNIAMTGAQLCDKSLPAGPPVIGVRMSDKFAFAEFRSIQETSAALMLSANQRARCCACTPTPTASLAVLGVHASSRHRHMRYLISGVDRVCMAAAGSDGLTMAGMSIKIQRPNAYPGPLPGMPLASGGAAMPLPVAPGAGQATAVPSPELKWTAEQTAGLTEIHLDTYLICRINVLLMSWGRWLRRSCRCLPTLPRRGPAFSSATWCDQVEAVPGTAGSAGGAGVLFIAKRAMNRESASPRGLAGVVDMGGGGGGGDGGRSTVRSWEMRRRCRRSTRTYRLRT